MFPERSFNWTISKMSLIPVCCITLIFFTKGIPYLTGVVSMKDVDSHSISLDVMPLSTGFLPMPSIRLSKYTAGGKSKTDSHSKVHPFPPGQVYNSTKSLQIHVIASVSGEQ